MLIAAFTTVTLLLTTLTVFRGTPARAQTACDVDYVLIDWRTGFVATVTITNNAPPLTSWELTWSFNGDQTIVHSWNVAITQDGPNVTARNVTYNGDISTGESVSFGFQASYSGVNEIPTDFALNGTPCNEPLPSPSTPSPSVTPTAVCTAPAYCDSFEDQTSSIPSGRWFMTYLDCQGTGRAFVDTTRAHTGSQSIRVHGLPGRCNHIFVQSTLDLRTLGPTVYVRLWLLSTNPLPSPRTTLISMTDTSTGGELRFGGQYGALLWHRTADDVTLPAPIPGGLSYSMPLPAGTWNCVEYLVDRGGFVRTWVNGTLIPGLEADGVPTPNIDATWLSRPWTPSLSAFRFGWEAEAGDSVLWFDDVVFAPTRIGC